MEVNIEKLDHFGRGICYIDGKICFVYNSLPGEVVDIDIIKETKSFIEANVLSIKKESKERIKPVCPYYGECGGCSLQHISYKLENQFKENKVKEILCRFGGVSSDKILPVSYSNELEYRNKITLHGNGMNMGLYKENSHDIVPISSCKLVLPIINEMIPKVPNMETCIIKASNDNKRIITSMDKDLLLTSIGNYQFYQSISSFFQVNSSLTKDLYDEVLNYVQDIKPNKVLDLYCGTGTIGIYVSQCCNSIFGVDYNPSNIEDANENKELNHVSNIYFICDKVENVIDSFKDFDLVIVDPPRSGLDSKTKEYLVKINPKTIIYVSCDPVTLARDIKDLSSAYSTISVKPFNMFPRTSHCENVCLLERR